MATPPIYVFPALADKIQLANTSMPTDLYRVYVQFYDVNDRENGGGTWMKRYANTPDPITSEYVQDDDSTWWVNDPDFTPNTGAFPILGLDGQVLRKNSANNYDTSWVYEVDSRPEEIVVANTSTGIGNVDSMYISITGNTAISNFDATADKIRFLRFTNTNILTHNTSSILLNGSNITTSANDSAIFVSSNTGIWKLANYNRATSSTLEYDEGNWTPVVEGSSTSGTYTYTTQVGKYTREGNLIHLSFYIKIDAVSAAGTGSILISGLPVASSESAVLDCGSISAFVAPATTITNFGGYTLRRQNTNQLVILYFNTSTSAIAGATVDVVGAATQIAGSLTYRI